MPGKSSTSYFPRCKKATVNGDINHVNGHYRKNVQTNVIDRNVDGREVHNTSYAGGQVNVHGSVKGRGKAVGCLENNMIGGKIVFSRSNGSNGEDSTSVERGSPNKAVHKLGSPPRCNYGLKPVELGKVKKLHVTGYPIPELADIESSSDSDDDDLKADGDTSDSSELSITTNSSDSDSDSDEEEVLGSSVWRVIKAMQRELNKQKEELDDQSSRLEEQKKEIKALRKEVKELTERNIDEGLKEEKRKSKTKATPEMPEMSEAPETYISEFVMSPQDAAEEREEE